MGLGRESRTGRDASAADVPRPDPAPRAYSIYSRRTLCGLFRFSRNLPSDPQYDDMHRGSRPRGRAAGGRRGRGSWVRGRRVARSRYDTYFTAHPCSLPSDSCTSFADRARSGFVARLRFASAFRSLHRRPFAGVCVLFAFRTLVPVVRARRSCSRPRRVLHPARPAATHCNAHILRLTDPS